MRKRILRIAAVCCAILVVAAAGAALWLRSQLAGSLPRLDGQIEVAGLSAPVRIERDELGIPTIHAESRLDLAFATGFAHGQDRFFQMDLLRRNSAGELAEMVGPAVLDADRDVRVHRFRHVAQRMVAAAPQDEREILESYARGVNAGLASLAKKPFEYMLLSLEPAPWRPEDSALVMFSMYLDLQGDDADDESTLGVLHDLMPQPMFDFLVPRGTPWDAPLVGEPLAVPPTPSADVVDLRKPKPAQNVRNLPEGRPAGHRFAQAVRRKRHGLADDLDHFKPGSNNWAVAGSLTRDGRAIVANDMHLGLQVPHVWYRAAYVWGKKDDPSGVQRITGATLPGTPAMVVGSNGHVAWGFTNSEGDWVDLVVVEPAGEDDETYRTPDGPRRFEYHTEVIKVKGGDDAVVDVVSTIWGPIYDEDHQGNPRALRWVAHDPEGVNMRLLRMESARTLDEALQLANECGSPAQNFVVADREGNVGWTILGRIPRRVGFDGRLPGSWADGSRRWDGWLKPQEYPRIVNPAGGRIWTANARVVDGKMLETLGDGGYDLGARAGQIRDDLLALSKADEAEMLNIQLDDRAVFLAPWQKLLLDLLTPQAIADHADRQQARELIENWGGRASTDSAGYFVVRSFRREVIKQVCDSLTAQCTKADPRCELAHLDRTEGPVWRLVTQRPAHLLDPRYKTWEAMLLASLDTSVAGLAKNGATLADCNWGAYNTSTIQHPLSKAVPRLSRWLDMPREPLPGDTANMPRIQGPSVGASERMAVSPGHEEEGYFHMPCGQSGHPLSPHYADAHAAWARGVRTPFLPGEPVHVLVLSPASDGT